MYHLAVGKGRRHPSWRFFDASECVAEHDRLAPLCKGRDQYGMQICPVNLATDIGNTVVGTAITIIVRTGQ